MKEFWHKHKLWIILGIGSIVLYFIYEWYESSAATSAANSNAADEAAAQEAYLNDLYGQGAATDSTGSSTASPATGTTPLANVVSTTPSTGANAAGGTAGASPSAPASSSGPSQAAGGSPTATPLNGGVVAGLPTTSQQLKQLGANYAYSPNESEAQDFAASGYTGNAAQDAANARSLASGGSELFLGNPQFAAGGSAQASPELVTACNNDWAAGIQCGSPGSESDITAFLSGLPTQGNYELGPNGSVVQLPPGVTPIGETPEEMANTSVYTAANGVVFVNGVGQAPTGSSAIPGTTGYSEGPVAVTGAQLPAPGSGLALVLQQETTFNPSANPANNLPTYTAKPISGGIIATPQNPPGGGPLVSVASGVNTALPSRGQVTNPYVSSLNRGVTIQPIKPVYQTS